MTADEKLQRIQQICPVSFVVDKAGKWTLTTEAKTYSSRDGEVSGGPVTASTWQEAVESLWDEVTKPGNHLAYTPKGCTLPRRYQWVGDLWYEFRLVKPKQASTKAAPDAPESKPGDLPGQATLPLEKPMKDTKATG